MEYGVQLGNLGLSELRDVAQMAEGLGLHEVSMWDHIVVEGPGRQFNPRDLAYDPMVMAATVIGATKKVRVGHLVLCNLFRHPAITARALTSLDQLSGGRLLAGLGAGWTEREFKMTGIPFPDISVRLRMLDEALHCIRSLWTKEQTTFSGDFYSLKEAILWPKPLQRPHPPILVGGGGKGLLRVAAKHADLVNIIPDIGGPGYLEMANVAKLTDDSVKTKVKFVREQAKHYGRHGEAIRISNLVYFPILTDSPAATRATAESMAPMLQTTPEGVLHSPLTLLGTTEEWAAELRRRTREWEVTHVVLSNVSGRFGQAELRRFAEEVIPSV
jgi:probable F420-dependent oxidoreductase